MGRDFRVLRLAVARRCTVLGPKLPRLHRSGALHREENFMESLRIDELARRLLERVPPALRAVQQDLEANFRAVLRERLAKLDLVTRDEFDAQTRVLERTRARLEALEARLAAMEAMPDAEPGASGGAAAGTEGPRAR
jgi:BMFP domain-containing protein YqiC